MLEPLRFVELKAEKLLRKRGSSQAAPCREAANQVKRVCLTSQRHDAGWFTIPYSYGGAHLSVYDVYENLHVTFLLTPGSPFGTASTLASSPTLFPPRCGSWDLLARMPAHSPLYRWCPGS